MLKKFFILSLLVGFLAAPVLASVAPATPAHAASCDRRFLTFKPWYHGLTKGSDCAIKNPTDLGSASNANKRSQQGLSRFIWTIALNVVEDIMQLGAYVATGFVIYGGFLYLTSAGMPDRTAAGKKTVLNAIIGLVIAMSAVVLVNLVARTALGLN